MNPLNINHIKVEKANLIKLRYQKLRKITNFFRVFEILLVLAVISRISLQVQLPLALGLKLSNEYLHSLSLILVSPSFVFVVGNAIVIVLFLNSAHPKPPCNVKAPKTPPNGQKRAVSQPRKQGKTEENTIMAAIFASPEPQPTRVYERSRSERVRREKVEVGCLRRSNTEVRSLKGCAHSSKGCCRKAGEGHYPEDHMSSEEFKRTIEDFIAKQQRFLRQEDDFSAL